MAATSKRTSNKQTRWSNEYAKLLAVDLTRQQRIEEIIARVRREEPRFAKEDAMKRRDATGSRHCTRCGRLHAGGSQVCKCCWDAGNRARKKQANEDE